MESKIQRKGKSDLKDELGSSISFYYLLYCDKQTRFDDECESTKNLHEDDRKNSKIHKSVINNNEKYKERPSASVSFKVPQPWSKKHFGRRMDDRWRKRIQLSKPSEIGAFKKIKHSGNAEVTVTHDSPPTINISSIIGVDLSDGFDPLGTGEDTEVPCSTDEIMICLNAKKFDLQRNRVNFVTYRNNLNKILGTPYQKDPWKIQVSRRQGIIFLEVVKDRSSEPEGEWQRRCCYWGRRFEEYCLGTPHNLSESDRCEHCVVVRTRLKSHRIIIGAEIDGCMQDPNGPGYVELKTSKQLLSRKDQWSFNRYKTLKYWIQSYLVGVPYILVGYRNNDGIICGFENLKTTALSNVQGRNKLWDSNVCLNFADQILTFLTNNTCENVNYELEFKEPFEQVTLVQI